MNNTNSTINATLRNAFSGSSKAVGENTTGDVTQPKSRETMEQRDKE